MAIAVFRCAQLQITKPGLLSPSSTEYDDVSTDKWVGFRKAQAEGYAASKFSGALNDCAGAASIRSSAPVSSQRPTAPKILRRPSYSYGVQVIISAIRRESPT